MKKTINMNFLKLDEINSLGLKDACKLARRRQFYDKVKTLAGLNKSATLIDEPVVLTDEKSVKKFLKKYSKKGVDLIPITLTPAFVEAVRASGYRNFNLGQTLMCAVVPDETAMTASDLGLPDDIWEPYLKYIKWYIIGITAVSCLGVIAVAIADEKFDEILPIITVHLGVILLAGLAPMLIKEMGKRLENTKLFKF